MSAEKLERQFFLTCLVGVSVLFAILMLPFFAPLLWACIVAVLFYPLQLRLEQRWGKRPNLTALTTLLLCMILVVIPVLLILGAFLQQGFDIYQQIKDGTIKPGEYVDQIRNAFPAVQSFLEGLNIDVASLRENVSQSALAASQFLAENALALGQSTFGFVLSLGIMLYVAFFLLRDGSHLIDKLIYYIPLGDERERLLFKKFAEVAKATVKGNLLVAMAQGTLGGLIFWILGLSPALLWGVVMTVLSLIPAIGAGLVWVPAAIYLYATGDWVAASVLIAFGVLVIGLVDNLLRPILVGRDTKLPDWLVLLSTLGGLTLVGLNGFVVGPLIAVLFVAFWQIFGREFSVHAEIGAKAPAGEETPSSQSPGNSQQ